MPGLQPWVCTLLSVFSLHEPQLYKISCKVSVKIPGGGAGGGGDDDDTGLVFEVLSLSLLTLVLSLYPQQQRFWLEPVRALGPGFQGFRLPLALEVPVCLGCKWNQCVVGSSRHISLCSSLTLSHSSRDGQNLCLIWNPVKLAYWWRTTFGAPIPR